MSFINASDFFRRFANTSISKIASNPKLIDCRNFTPIEDSLIHYIPDSDSSLGPTISFSLLRNSGRSTGIFHINQLVQATGSPIPTRTALISLIKAYHRANLDIKQITNLDQSLSINHYPLIINYGFLLRLYTYPKSPISLYTEWFNIRATLWNQINQISTRKQHFVYYKIPKTLPDKAKLNQCLKDFKLSHLEDFHTTDDFNLIELWRLLHPEITTYLSNIKPDTIDNVTLVFFESGFLSFIRLEDLFEWSAEDSTACINGFYRFLEKLVSLRTGMDSDTIEKETKDDTHITLDPNIKLHRLIKEHGESGNLTESEQKGLLKLSSRYKKIPDPKDPSKTVAETIESAPSTKLITKELIADNKFITDKSMLKSSVTELEQQYIKDHLHRDVLSSILMLQDAGIIIKDIKTKRKMDCANKVDEYAVQLQPVAAEGSTIHFTLPVIEKDGSFTSGGVKYRMDRQKGSLPIVKSKINEVSLSSYYGKLFLTRTETVVNNYAKWIIKQILAMSVGADPVISKLDYALNKEIPFSVPRAYSAISDTFSAFTIKRAFVPDSKQLLTFDMMFNPNLISQKFFPNELTLAKKLDLTLCGRDAATKTPLAMDQDGVIYVLWKENKIELLGTLPFIMDPDLGDGPVEYTELSVLNNRVPLILVLMAATYHLDLSETDEPNLVTVTGLDSILKLLKIEYKLEAINTKATYDPTRLRVKFKDIIYNINISNRYHRLIIGGFNRLKDITARYKGSDFNNIAAMGSIFNSLGYSNYQLKEIRLMADLFIDPITKELLKEFGEPTSFIALLVKASNLLVDDFIPSTNSVRYKGYERLCGLLYAELINAVRAHRASGELSRAEVTLNPRSVHLKILQDQTIGLVEQSNPIQRVKEIESFTVSGHGGRSADTMVKNTRGFTEHDIGVVSEATPDSGKVGIRAYVTPNSKITSVRGTTEAFDPKTDGPTSVISSTSLLAPAITHDAPVRVN